MKQLKEICICTVPYMTAAVLLFPFIAIVGGSTDPFMWERVDRMFYFICIVGFGSALLSRLLYVSKSEQ